jgi:hypothetical protein
MGRLDKEGLDALLARGCPACGAASLAFRSYVDGLLPLLGGEPVGRLKWVYDGEAFVDGVFHVACARCKAEVFASTDCPRCHAAAGLARALESENAFPVPVACPSCGGEEVRLVAIVPARTTVELLDPGFHAHRVDCKSCGTVARLEGRCPLCDAEGPLRARPG